MSVVTVNGVLEYCNEVLGDKFKHVKVQELVNPKDTTPRKTNFLTAIVKESVAEPVIVPIYEMADTGLRLISEGKTLTTDEVAVYILAGDLNQDGVYEVDSIRTFLQIYGAELTDEAIERLIELSSK